MSKLLTKLFSSEFISLPKEPYGLSELLIKKAQIGKDHEKAQSEKDSHTKNRDGKKLNKQSSIYTTKTYRQSNGLIFSQKVATQLP